MRTYIWFAFVSLKKIYYAILCDTFYISLFFFYSVLNDDKKNHYQLNNVGEAFDMCTATANIYVCIYEQNIHTDLTYRKFWEMKYSVCNWRHLPLIFIFKLKLHFDKMLSVVRCHLQSNVWTATLYGCTYTLYTYNSYHLNKCKYIIKYNLRNLSYVSLCTKLWIWIYCHLIKTIRYVCTLYYATLFTYITFTHNSPCLQYQVCTYFTFLSYLWLAPAATCNVRACIYLQIYMYRVGLYTKYFSVRSVHI